MNEILVAALPTASRVPPTLIYRLTIIRIVFSVFCLIAYSSAAQVASDLPDCPSNETLSWDNCFGTKTSVLGEYVGEFKEGKKHGTGTYKETWNADYPSHYEGSWKNDQQHGYGHKKSNIGAPWEYDYMGFWGNGIMSGPGLLSMFGSRYRGEFAGDFKLNGHGSLFDENGFGYIGDWKDGKKHGEGIITMKDSRYFGQFKDDNFHGQGTLTISNGTKYFGAFKNGDMHGQGTTTLSDGTSFNGYFIEGEQLNVVCENMGLSEQTPEHRQCILKLFESLDK